MWSELEDAIEDERAALEKDVAPVPAVILDDVVRLGLHPKVKCDQCDPADPPETEFEFNGSEVLVSPKQKRSRTSLRAQSSRAPRGFGSTRRRTCSTRGSRYVISACVSPRVHSSCGMEVDELEQDDIHELSV